MRCIRFWDTSWNKSLRPQIGPFWLCKLPLEWFHTFHILGQDWAAFYYYCVISIIVGKWTKADLSGIENDLLNNSIKSISSGQLINIIPKKLYANNKEKWPDCFEQIAEKHQNNQIWPFRHWKKWHLERFNRIIFAVHSLKPHVKIEKRLSNSFYCTLIDTFLRKLHTKTEKQLSDRLFEKSSL